MYGTVCTYECRRNILQSIVKMLRFFREEMTPNGLFDFIAYIIVLYVDNKHVRREILVWHGTYVCAGTVPYTFF